MKEKIIKNIKELLPYIIILLIIALFRSFIATPIKVNGNSMYNTLNGTEFMILNKLGNIDRYDIIVVDTEDDELIKRVYGLPGEKIEIQNNMIYINDKKIEDKYAYGNTSNYEAITLAEDEYFVLGDNRVVSLDSRIIGPVKKKDIKGTTNFIVYPFNRFGALEKWYSHEKKSNTSYRFISYFYTFFNFFYGLS